MPDLFKLTRKLVEIPSVTGHEHQIGEFLFRYLKDAGFTTDKQEVADGRFNVLAQSGPSLVTLSTHMDTVSPVIEFSEDGEFIYGRGACDAKGIIASQIKAAEKLLDEGITGFGMLYVVGEETESDGAHAANTLETESRFLVNGEPTGNTLAMGSKGSINVDIIASGKAAHSACPEQGESAILKLLNILHDLQKTAFPSDSLLGDTTMNIGMIEGGTQYNVIPDRAVARLKFRTVYDNELVKNVLESSVHGRAEIRYQFECPPVRFEMLDGFETTVAAFTTDIPMLTGWGRPFLIGPGSILDAHTDHEKILKDDLVSAVDIYHDLVMRLLK